MKQKKQERSRLDNETQRSRTTPGDWRRNSSGNCCSSASWKPKNASVGSTYGSRFPFANKSGKRDPEENTLGHASKAASLGALHHEEDWSPKTSLHSRENNTWLNSPGQILPANGRRSWGTNGCSSSSKRWTMKPERKDENANAREERRKRRRRKRKRKRQDTKEFCEIWRLKEAVAGAVTRRRTRTRD